MPLTEIHVSDALTRFRFEVLDEDGTAIDLNNAEEITVRFTRPNATSFDRTLSDEEVTINDDEELAEDLGVEVEELAALGWCTYIAQPEELNLSGRWRTQSIVVMPGGGSWSSSIESFIVHANLPAPVVE